MQLHFPLAEFIVSMGFLLVFVLEQMLLAFRDPMGCESLEKKAHIDPHVTKSRDSSGCSRRLSGADESLEKQALIDPHMTQSRDSPGRSRRLSGTYGSASPEHIGLRVFLLVFCLCVCALVEGLSAGSKPVPELIPQICAMLFLRQGIVAFSLSVRMSHYGLRQAVTSGCLFLFSLSCPVGIGIGMGMGMGMVGMNPSAPGHLVRCAVEGLASGIFIYISIAGLRWQESVSPKHRIHKVTFLLTGFALVTVVLFCKV